MADDRPAVAIDVDGLTRSARSARDHAYAPYSGLRVGAALLSVEGTVFTGVNVENAAYPVTLCAERAALGAAVSAGQRDFVALAVACDGAEPCLPCGMCRQALLEFGAALTVLAAGASGPPVRYRLGADLLPAAFDRGRLGR